MSQANPLQWLHLALFNFEHHFAPGGWTIFLLLTNTHPRNLHYHGLWQEIYKSWVQLEGESLQDPIAFDEDNPLASALIAGEDITSYLVHSGRKFLTMKLYPEDISKWSNVLPNLEWMPLWKAFMGVRQFLPPQQTTFWWRFLQHNVMTTN